MSVEVKVGILFLFIAILAVAAGLFLTETTHRLGTYDLVVHFKDVNGLASGADVMLAGVSIGKVSSVTLSPDPHFPEHPVAVRLALKRNTALFATDRFVVDQGALLGDKYIAVQRPTQRELAAQGLGRGPRLAAKAEVMGGPSAGFANLSEQVATLIAEAHDSIVALKLTYASPEIREGIALLMANVSRATGQFDAIAGNTQLLIGNLNKIVTANQGAVTRSIGNIEAATVEIKTITQQVRSAVDGIATGPIPAQLLVTALNLRTASEDVRASTEAIRGMVADTENQRRIESLLASLAQAGQDVAEISGSLKTLTADEQLQSDIRATLENVKITTENLREVTEASRQIITSKENLEAINATIANLRTISEQGLGVTAKADQALTRVERTMDELGQVTTAISPDQLTGRLRMEAAHAAPLRADIDFDLRYGADPYRFWRVGVRGFGRNETLNLQYSFPLGQDTWARAGIFGNRPGVALNYRLSPRAVLELEAWDPGDNRLDLRTYWQLGRDYALTAGLERVLRDNEPFVGLAREVQLGPRRPQP